MRCKRRPQLLGAGRTRAGHHHGSHTPTSPGTILLGKIATKCNKINDSLYPISIMFIPIYIAYRVKNYTLTSEIKNN